MIETLSDYEFLTCGECGIKWGMPRWFVETRRKGDQKSRNYYCPNGHCRVFKETENDRLRRERDQLKQDAARLEDERAAAVAAQKKAEKELKRTFRRATAGVCPCCHRSFQALVRHMKTKHPGVVARVQEKG
jgi:hypothetical protein